MKPMQICLSTLRVVVLLVEVEVDAEVEVDPGNTTFLELCLAALERYFCLADTFHVLWEDVK